MKILVEGFSSPKHNEIISSLQKKGCEVVYWVAKKRVRDFLLQNKAQFEKTIFHDYTDALAAIPADGVDTRNFKPVGTDILDKLVKYEPQLLSLMTRIDFGDITFAEKHHRYYQYVWYWQGVLSQLQPDVVVFHDVPHIVFDTTLAYVAQAMGIKTVFMRSLTGMRDYVTFFSDFHNYSEVLEEYNRLKDVIKDFVDLDHDVAEVVTNLKNLKPNNLPFKYASYSGFSGKEKTVEVFPKFGRIWRSIKEFRFLQTTIGYVRMLFKRTEQCSITKQSPIGVTLLWRNIGYRKLRQGFKKEYLSLCNAKPDLSVPYVYFPLHAQPEATTNPMGGVFTDQILAVDLLARSLPQGWKLYIKEHTDQWVLPRVHTGRYPGYYREMSRHSNVELVSTDISGFDLIDSAGAVATIAGTTPLEAVVRGKSALVFGYPLYVSCEGMFQITDFDSCLSAMNKIAGGYLPDEVKVWRFFQAMANISVGAYIHKRHGVGSKHSYQESLQNLTNGLYQACLK